MEAAKNEVGRITPGQSGTNFLPIQQFWKSSKLDEIVTIDPSEQTYCNARKKYEDHATKPVKIRLSRP